MSNSLQISTLIHLKVQKLLEEREMLQKRVKALEENQQNLLKQLEEQKNSNRTIEETNKIIKLASSLDKSDDSKELKKMLKSYIRDLDECIRLLSER